MEKTVWIWFVLRDYIFNLGSLVSSPADGDVFPIRIAHGRYGPPRIAYVTAQQNIIFDVGTLLCVTIGVLSLGVVLYLRKRAS